MTQIKRVLLLILIAFSYSHRAYSSNILWLAGLASPSHQLWGGALQRALAARGHNLTALSVDVVGPSITNLTFIHLENVYAFIDSTTHNLTAMRDNSPIADIWGLAHFRSDSCVPALASKGMRQLLDYPKSFKFDLVVHDFAGLQCLLGLLPTFGNPPLVSVSASTCPIGMSSASGNPQYPSFIPVNHLRVGYGMSFLTKLWNFILYAYDNSVRESFMMARQNVVARKFFKDDSIDVSAISRSSVITLVNLPPFDVMQPFFQTVIPVGGLHIQNPKPLDEELTNFIEGSESGFVYFALGTNLKADHFSPEQVARFLAAFRRFPAHRFLWKHDPARLGAPPENVMIRKWMPQNDILGHPKIMAFIGHGGALSCQEAVWYGVPQLLIPFIIDQKHNAARAVERGIALMLEREILTEEMIVQALYQLLHNNTIKENMLQVSRAFRDQPQQPLERAVFWVEYALRHGSSSRLRSPGQDLGLLRQLSVDIVLTGLACISVVLAIATYCTKILIRKLMRKKKLKLT